MITINNSIFDAKGANKKDWVYGITLKGSEDVTIKDCEFKNMGYSSIANHSTGAVTVEDCIFNCADVYNPIEGSQQVANGNLIVKNCEFKGAPGNNYINFYQFKDGSKHVIEGCKFNPTVDNNIVRVSNRTNAAMEVLVKDCAYDFAAGEPTAYTNFLLCQDYTNKSGVQQDFTKVKVILDNVACDGVKIGEEGPVKGGLFYVYEDGVGLITGLENDPVVIVK